MVNVFGITSDEVVRKGQPLLSVSGNDYMTVQRTILYGLRAMELTPRTAAQPQDPAAFSMDEARLSFRSIGLSEEQFQDVAKTRKLLTEIPLLSPVTGDRGGSACFRRTGIRARDGIAARRGSEPGVD